jgi:drug/metabolite transporter (DMT)-like permease
LGFVFIFAASAFMVSKDIVSKSLATDLKGGVSAFASFAFSIPWYVLALVVLFALGFEDFAFKEGFLLLVVARSITDTFAEAFRMSAFRYGELSQVSSFLAISPVFILLFEPYLVGDILTFRETAGVLVSLVGGLVVIYQPWKSISKHLVVYGLLTALFFALNSCFDRLSVGKGSPTLAAALMTGLSAVFLLPILFKGGTITSLRAHFKPLMIRGFFELAFMVMKLSALVYLPASKVSAVMRGTLILSVVAGAIFFKEKDFLRKSIGAIITAAGLFLAFS